MVVLAEIKTFFTALANHLVGVGRQGVVGVVSQSCTLVLLLTVRMAVLVALLGNVAGTVAVGLW
jgi:hypothetical protein